MQHPVLVYRPSILGKPGVVEIPVKAVLTDESASHDGRLIITVEGIQVEPGQIQNLIVEVQHSANLQQVIDDGRADPEGLMTKLAAIFRQREEAVIAARLAGWDAY